MRRSERGYALVALLAALAIMAILMAVAASGWRYVMKNDREEELFFRGTQIAQAIERYQKKRGNALPTTLDLLVKEKFLRKAYKDPMTPDGKWRLLRPGQPAALSMPGRPGASPSPSPSPSPSSVFGTNTGPQAGIGPFTGVASASQEKSLRLMNGQDQYDRWLFLAGQPRWIGRPPGVRQGPVPGGTGPGNTPPVSNPQK